MTFLNVDVDDFASEFLHAEVNAAGAVGSHELVKDADDQRPTRSDHRLRMSRQLLLLLPGGWGVSSAKVAVT